jgi:glycosyltransferase involved in cell wall biosynthesis
VDKPDTRISVVIPLYNKKRYVARAIDSVLRQTFQDFEIIVVDDGSTDGSAGVVRGFSDPRIRLIQQENAGVSAARNRGVREARHDLVAFLDADDRYKDSFLAQILRLRERYPQAGAYATNVEYIVKGGEARLVTRGLPGKDSLLDLRSFITLCLNSCPVYSSAIAVTKEVLERAGGFPVGVRYAEDLDTWLRIVAVSPIAFDHAAGAEYDQEAAGRTCHQLAPESSYRFFTTLDRIVEEQGDQKDLRELAREHKNRYIILYGIHQIRFVSRAAGRRVLLDCHTRRFFRKKWRWIWRSLWPISRHDR